MTVIVFLLFLNGLYKREENDVYRCILLLFDKTPLYGDTGFRVTWFQDPNFYSDGPVPQKVFFFGGFEA